MKILLLEAFYISSHKLWADGLVRYSTHDIDLISMSGKHWKWRMEHSAVYFSEEIKIRKKKYDLIICSDLTNISVLKGLLATNGNTQKWYNNIPVLLYFHENQITYPWSENDPDVRLNRDQHYGWINYLSCIAADKIIFNSEYHRTDFLDSLPIFFKKFPSDIPHDIIDRIIAKSFVLPIGLELKATIAREKKTNTTPVILWNHRWEYDKNPDLFFNLLFRLVEEDIDFNVIIVGEKYKRYPEIFNLAVEKLGSRILHFGYVESREEYLNLLIQSDIFPVTSNQDFFGISVVEGIAAGSYPILPRRLAFPEHLEGSSFDEHYYDKEDELYDHLKMLLSGETFYSSDTRKEMIKYDVESVIKMYDNFFRKNKYLETT